MEIAEARSQCKQESEALGKYLQQEGPQAVVAQFTNQWLLLKEVESESKVAEDYPEDQRTRSGKMQDDHLPMIKKWLH